MKSTSHLKNIKFFVLLFGCIGLSAQDSFIEEVFVTAEKRSESLQDISQAVTAISDEDIENKNITSFVDLSAIVPGVTVAKNEGYKTVISIRGVGNETNQNAIAAPSVAFHMDGIFIASPFSLQTDFIDVERIEVLRGPQGTLFGQNSTGGVINVISKKPSMEGYLGKSDITFGNYGLTKFRSSNNIVLGSSTAARFSISTTERDGFSENLVTGQDLDDDSNLSLRADFLTEFGNSSSLRFFGQFFEVDRNGSAMKGIDDPSPDPRDLSQDSISNHELTSKIFAAIYESDLGYANLKIMASMQEDDISVTRDNDRHNFGDPVLAIPGLGDGATYQRAEFRPETSLVDTTTFEINLVSNEPAVGGKLDWTIGAFYMDHEIENHIRGYRDNDLDGELQYVCGEPFARNDYCFTVGGPDPWFFFEFDFVSDAFPKRESFSVYGETTYSVSDEFRILSGLRYSDDEVESCVKNFFTTVCDNLSGSSDKTTGKIAAEFDLDDDTLAYLAFSAGFKPGGTNLTYGFADDNAPPMVFPNFAAETVESMEFGLKTDLYDGRARANIAIFSYDYENLQFQATDPDPYRGGVANIPESEMSGLEIEFTGLISDSLTLDMNLAFLDSEVSSDYEALDNVDAYQYFFGEEDLRYGLRKNIKGNELAKTPEFTADITMTYETVLSSGTMFTGILQYVERGEFQQRVNNNPIVDAIDAYDILNLTASLDFVGDKWGLDFMILNATDEDGVNSSMTDVFGVAATGLELIPPRQYMLRLSMNY
ncbi:MAG: TonB-dependent receptor [SAR86 cluster bacterium]|uniref:TonB-dependent receptor n=1 Tax=SAR86 cluster bacterium TaxID=2030880 RepID=A0A368C028_9GAMM|nr:MAG: TonB-dependent receptor [SAR86 cluster bacterium]